MSGYSLHIISSTDDSNILGFNDSRKKPFTREYKREMGEKLKALRNAKGLSVEKAAELFGKSEGTIKAFERGDSLTGDNMVDLCRFYGCAISDFFPEGLLQYCIPNRKTIQMMDTNDLLRVMKLATDELCKRNTIEV